MSAILLAYQSKANKEFLLKKRKLIIILIFSLCLVLASVAKEESIVGLTDHELGDQTISINAGLFVPLPFLEFDGTTHPSNQTLGVAGALQWNAYLNSLFRIGLEVGGSITFGPDTTTFLMMPITVKGTYLLTYDRFEFPLFLGLGGNIVKYGSGESFYDVALVVKPGFSAYYRYNSNLSFGLNVIYWWNVELPATDYDAALMGNSIEISPSLFYHF